MIENMNEKYNTKLVEFNERKIPRDNHIPYKHSNKQFDYAVLREKHC